MKKNLAIVILIVVIIFITKSCSSVITTKRQTKTNSMNLKTVELPSQKIETHSEDISPKINNEFYNYENNNYTEQNLPPRLEHISIEWNAKPHRSEHKITKENIRTIEFERPLQKKIEPQISPFEKNLKICEPYRESLNTEYMGINMTYTISIDGWINNKCILNFNAEANNAGESFQNTYGIAPDDAIIKAFAPKVHCEFTKAHLDYVGDSILEEKLKNQRHMLKNPDDIDFSNSNISDFRLLDILINQKPCIILNSNELDEFIN